MSFNPRYTRRYNEIIKPAVEDALIEGMQLEAYRVDNSQTGDSILTMINDGIAHSRIIFADVSIMYKKRRSKISFRNGNVMYEVGVALACRNPSDVLLIRDDNMPLLFDLSTIPHITVDFDRRDRAISVIRSSIADRLREQDLVNDVRTEMLV